MGPGSLRLAIERKSFTLLHRSIRTASSIFATYSASESHSYGKCRNGHALGHRLKTSQRAYLVRSTSDGCRIGALQRTDVMCQQETSGTHPFRVRGRVW